MKKIAIFDLDGTLLNTITDIGYSMNEVLKRHSLPVHDMEAYKIFVGNGARILTQRALPEDRQDLTDTVLQEYKEEYGRNLVRMTKPYDGIEEMLARLQNNGVMLGIFTNKPHEDMKTLVSKLFGNVPFFDCKGQRDGIPLKPDPSVLLNMTEGYEGYTKYFIGDTCVDVATGKNARFVTIGCAWGFRGEDELKPADYVAHHPSDVAEYILNDNR